MTQSIFSQLEKVLALVDSSHEGEALGALRMAQRILRREGLSFCDLALAARKSRYSPVTRSLFSGSQAHNEMRIEQLEADLYAHMEQNESLTSQIEFWRKRAVELEQLVSVNKGEAERWREMARETAERLWDLGQIARAEKNLEGLAYEDVEKQSENIESVCSEKLKAAS